MTLCTNMFTIINNKIQYHENKIINISKYYNPFIILE